MPTAIAAKNLKTDESKSNKFETERRNPTLEKKKILFYFFYSQWPLNQRNSWSASQRSACFNAVLYFPPLGFEYNWVGRKMSAGEANMKSRDGEGKMVYEKEYQNDNSSIFFFF